ncbi:PREDICTED: protein FAM200A-like [Diuraphis noxia]|uniref:protein FAM200A-like n=1 Tax=Diuraphis noxia TaxID=143948 RepID=UPI000763A176|nr:PREDICTED: protein FAM200A-like [Diuraphis noxia]
MWILNPFLPCEKHELSLLNESQLLELSSDKLLGQFFNTKSLNQFWISLSKEYPNLYEEALKKLLPFATTYSCESGFSTLTTIKTKSRSKLDVEPTIRISLTNSIEAQIDSLAKQHQDQGSH